MFIADCLAHGALCYKTLYHPLEKQKSVTGINQRNKHTRIMMVVGADKK